MSNLDMLFSRYVVALLDRAHISESDDGWRADIDGLPTLTGHATYTGDIRQAVATEIEHAVFERMRRGERLPVVTGIDINGGSC